ncbi:MAG: COX15/CtaA family protein, partial [Planctomycetia bacterium]
MASSLERNTADVAAHWAALATTVLTFVLLFVGGLVTSYDVGMAVPDYPTTFGQSMVWYNFLQDSLGVKLEHSHRLMGMTVGIAACVAYGINFFTEQRKWVRHLAAAVLVGVLIQGLLGGFRVRLNELMGRELALVHGCVGQAFFGVVAALSLVTSRLWSATGRVVPETGASLPKLTLLVTGLLYSQVL